MRKTLGLICVFFSAYANAEVAHPENPNVVGTITNVNAVCFQNDGSIASAEECKATAQDEGWVYISPFAPKSWAGGAFEGIKGCGIAAVNPVSSAVCPLRKNSNIAICVPDAFVLVQTTKSGNYFAVKSNGTCGAIATPEATGIVPCRVTDAFDPVDGCTEIGNKTGVAISGTYLQLEGVSNPPPASHCSDESHDGRMVVDSVNDFLYVCTESGWTRTSLVVP